MQELDRLRDLADPERAARASARHKRDRETLGITPAALEEVVAEWRAERDLDARIALAEALWDSDVHEPAWPPPPAGAGPDAARRRGLGRDHGLGAADRRCRDRRCG